MTTNDASLTESLTEIEFLRGLVAKYEAERSKWMTDTQYDPEAVVKWRIEREILIDALEHIVFITTKGTSKILPEATLAAVRVRAKDTIKRIYDGE